MSKNKFLVQGEKTPRILNSRARRQLTRAKKAFEPWAAVTARNQSEAEKAAAEKKAAAAAAAANPTV